MKEKLINIIGKYNEINIKRPFNIFIISIIIINSIILGVESILTDIDTHMLSIANEIFLYIFVFEMLLKLFVWRLNFFKNAWNIFDLTIILICLIPVPTLSIFRALRVLRIFRLLSSFSKTRKIITALLTSLPSMFSVISILLLFFYIYAIICTNLFGESFPKYFGNLADSVYSLFQVMTLESWSEGIVRPIMNVYPYAGFIFISFIFLTSYCILNLVVGIIVTTMQEEAVDDSCIKNNIARELAEIKEELKRLKQGN